MQLMLSWLLESQLVTYDALDLQKEYDIPHGAYENTNMLHILRKLNLSHVIVRYGFKINVTA